MPLDFELKKVKEDEDGLIVSTDITDLTEPWVDYQPNSLAWPIMSSKMKNIIENNLTGMEGIEWIKATINGRGEKRVYYILRFTKKLNVLNSEHTKYIPGTDQILKPCFSLLKVLSFSMFHDEPHILMPYLHTS